MAKKLAEDRKRYFVIHSDTYKQDIAFCFNMTPKECVAVFKRKGWELSDESREYILADKDPVGGMSVTGTMYPLSKGFLVTLYWPKSNFRRNIANAVHEITHVTHYILRNVRIPLIEDTEEAYTYLVEDLFQKFLFKLW